MSLNATVVAITQPGATGNQTYSLAANFDPKAIIVLGNSVSTTGLRGMVTSCIGFGTYRGAVVQQAWNAITDEDANATASNTFGRSSNDAVAKFTASTSNTIVAAVSLVSMQTGATSQFVLNWSTRTALFTPGLTVLVLGGSDLTDACAAQVSTAATTGAQNFTVATGFGKPDCLFMSKGGDTTNPTTFGSQSPFNFAFNNQAAGGRNVYFNSVDGAASQDVRTRISTNKMLYGGISGTVQIDATLAAAASWPTDGFQLTFTTAAVIWPMSYLALRLSANARATVGGGTVPSTAITQALSPSAGTARAAVVFGLRTTTADTDITTGTDNGYVSYGFAAEDGTLGTRGILDQDLAATSITDDTYSSTKAIQYYNPATEAVTAEASASVVGNDMVLNWTDPDTSAWVYEWLVLSEVVAGGSPASTGQFFPLMAYHAPEEPPQVHGRRSLRHRRQLALPGGA